MWMLPLYLHVNKKSDDDVASSKSVQSDHSVAFQISILVRQTENNKSKPN